MAKDTNKVRKMREIIQEKGSASLELAKKEIEAIDESNSNLSKTLGYFSYSTLRNPLPIFPALVAISCEAVGGIPESVISFGKATVFIASAADLHDDIIDQSVLKGSRKTVFGKFGTVETILAGDALLARGLSLLSEACVSIGKVQRETINHLAADSIFYLCVAESLETDLRMQGLKVKPESYIEIIKHKASFTEFTLRMGAIVGGGDLDSVDILGEFGRFFGLISTIADEFSDLLNPDELAHRMENECPPLPLIYALQNKNAKTKLIPLLKLDLADEKIAEAIAAIVLSTTEVKTIIQILNDNGKMELEKIKLKIKRKSQEELETILLAPLEFLTGLLFLEPASPSS